MTRSANASGGGQRVQHFVGSFSDGPPRLHDDCPWCRAMKACGIEPGPDGVAIAEPEQQRAYEAKVAEILAAEGMPEGAVAFQGDELELRHEMAVKTMTAEGWPEDPYALAPEQRNAFYARYSALLRGAHDGPSMN